MWFVIVLVNDMLVLSFIVGAIVVVGGGIDAMVVVVVCCLLLDMVCVVFVSIMVFMFLIQKLLSGLTPIMHIFNRCQQHRPV